tara:strand:+ start:186 stop:836 length:651 start_codon:yes stop_codon:yes gene_type:complete
MIALELFAGSRSFGKVAEEYGHDVISTDIEQFGNIDWVGNILDIPLETFTELKPDIIWASPPCTTFSIASCSHHYNKIGGILRPISLEAMLGQQILLKTIDIIKACNPKYFFIENPRGLMRKMNCMKDMERTTIWYCTYGDTRAKPTDIWSNHIKNIFNPDGWQPRPECFNGNKQCQHEAAPRGSKTGTQGLKNNHERSKIPAQLMIEIIKSIPND